MKLKLAKEVSEKWRDADQRAQSELLNWAMYRESVGFLDGYKQGQQDTAEQVKATGVLEALKHIATCHSPDNRCSNIWSEDVLSKLRAVLGEE